MLIYNAWELNESEEMFYLLSENLRKEMMDYDEPQEDIMSSKYNEFVKIISEMSYEDYTNEKLGDIVSGILKKQVTVVGEEPIQYPCPCCGNKTLSIHGEYDICSCCGWEDDGIKDDDKYSAPNHMTLGQGKRNYLLSGHCVGYAKK